MTLSCLVLNSSEYFFSFSVYIICATEYCAVAYAVIILRLYLHVSFGFGFFLWGRYCISCPTFLCCTCNFFFDFGLTTKTFTSCILWIDLHIRADGISILLQFVTGVDLICRGILVWILAIFVIFCILSHISLPVLVYHYTNSLEQMSVP